ncbi:molybdenum ABC transporter, periplasmic molybdate-binding protein [Hoeflea sp. IMCC20628]|uniref:molybdate ABC transporter substrate-binding protein n=1 Tax=Hoeflea sp. IMCC20628 TaxID=1620421 RepID=UPI00063AE807|nr:molybdate ABC transporter substrate-binding protein [Hoeflea sp. IMCC20628]AKI00061.1 molybdenum ABC transporter, periplasmic molybdate-binding protein [Hoeflea sp. IMCC20628]
MPARLIRRMLGVLVVAGLTLSAVGARADDVLVFAAASLKTALDQVATDWRSATGKSVTISYAGSSSLARQIEQGAPADIFVSASVDWMDYLQTAKMIHPDTRTNLLGNRLVLIAHGRDAPGIDLGPDTDLAGLLGDEWLAMALVDSVPAGIYGKEALSSLGLWDTVSSKVAQTDNVRAALALVSSGEAPFGIVYATDAVADGTVSVVAVFPEESHAPIIYPAAIVSTSVHPEAAAFLEVLRGPVAAEVFRAQGFLPLIGQGDG